MAQTQALYTLNTVGQLRGSKVEMASVDPKLPDFEKIAKAICSNCKKEFPVEKTPHTGIIRIKKPKVFLALVVWAGASPDTDAQVLDLFYNHGRRQCECCGDESGFMIGRGRAQASLLPIARTNAAKMALQTDCTHVLFVDQDTSEFDGEAILRMAGHNLPIVSAYICRRAAPYDPVHRYISDTGLPQTPQPTHDELRKLNEGDVQECYGVGMAFTLVRRDVLEALGNPYFRFNPADLNNPDSGWFHGEDMSFCQNARAKGFKSYVDCGVHLAHLHEKPIGVDDWLKHYQEIALTQEAERKKEEQKNVEAISTEAVFPGAITTSSYVWHGTSIRKM